MGKKQTKNQNQPTKQNKTKNPAVSEEYKYNIFFPREKSYRLVILDQHVQYLHGLFHVMSKILLEDQTVDIFMVTFCIFSACGDTHALSWIQRYINKTLSLGILSYI